MRTKGTSLHQISMLLVSACGLDMVANNTDMTSDVIHMLSKVCNGFDSWRLPRIMQMACLQQLHKGTHLLFPDCANLSNKEATTPCYSILLTYTIYAYVIQLFLFNQHIGHFLVW